MSKKKTDELSKIKQIPKGDTWANLTTGIGGPVDKSQYAMYQRFPTLWETELDNLYEQNAIAARIVDRLVEDSTREGFELSGPDKAFDFSSLQSEIEDYDIMTVVSKAWKQARLKGGALIIPAVNDGRKFDEPLDLDNLTNIINMRVVDSFRAIPSQYNYGRGSTSYLEPEFYLIQETNGKQKKIHSSRCIRLEGIPDISDRRKLMINNGWGPSVLQRVYRELSMLGQAEDYLANIMHECSVLTWKVEGLFDQLCGTDGQKEDIQKMVESTKALMDNLHVLLMDSTSEVSETKRDVSGLDKIIDKFVDLLVRATPEPRTIILGEQPGGLNANADGEIRGWYDYVHSQQKNYLTPVLNKILKLIFKVRERRGKIVPLEWNIENTPLWQPSETEQADTLLKNMQAYQIASTQRFMTVEEVRDLLISKGVIQTTMGAPIKAAAPEAPIAEQDEESLEAPPSLEPIPPDLCSTKKAAEMLGVPTLTINKMCREGKLKYWQYGSRMQVSMSEVGHAGRVDSSNRVIETLDASDVGIFIRSPLPPVYLNGQENPSHITFLVMSNINGKYKEFQETLITSLEGIGKINASYSGVEKMKECSVTPITFDKDMNLIRKMLINTLESRGFEIDMRFPKWNPHMTLSYNPNDKWEDIPEGSFPFKELEIWGLGDPVIIPLS